MRVLIVATNATPPGLSDEVRVDYLELAQRFGTVYHDYNALPSRCLCRRVEEMCRLDIRQALAVAHLAKCGGYDAVVSLSERVGILLGRLLDQRIRHMVIFITVCRGSSWG